ncbi:MAG: heparinase II/III family protein [Alphaproteobacteria bacterium]
MLDKARLYAETLRHLQPVQIYGRLLHKMRSRRLPAGETPARRAITGPWHAPCRPPASLVGQRRVRLLNEEGSIEAARDWTARDRSPLWAYTLHYFEDMVAEGAQTRRAWQADLIKHWLAGNPPLSQPAWAPYPLSLRIPNWIMASLDGWPLPEACVDSLALQARALARSVEHHLQGNHVLANAKGLIFAGLFFRGAEAGAWLDEGERLFLSQWRKQILSDGGHFERSAMYHAILLKDLLDVINLYGAYGRDVPVHWGPQARDMLDWLSAMTHPDGAIALFNDAAVDGAPSPSALAAYAARLGIAAPDPAGGPGSVDLAATGYVRMAFPSYTAFLDAAPVGPDHIPGHAHADTLSFELSVGTTRVIVDGGTSTYQDPEHRPRERSTAAHNTVELDGSDSSEVWAQFRVARRARIMDRAVEIRETMVGVTAAHDGYARLPGSPVHTRTWVGTGQDLTITDRLTGVRGAKPVPVLRFHLDPRVQGNLDNRTLTVRGPDGTWLTDLVLDPGLSWTLEPALVARSFGIREHTSVLIGRGAPEDLPRTVTTRIRMTPAESDPSVA